MVFDSHREPFHLGFGESPLGTAQDLSTPSASIRKS
jgi:hypothetical protein